MIELSTLSAVVCATIFVSSCSNAAESALARIPSHQYLTCPKIDLNSVPMMVDAPLNGPWEGLAGPIGTPFSGVELTLVGVGKAGIYSFMLHYFPVTSSPDSYDYCQAGSVIQSDDGNLYIDAFKSSIALSDDYRAPEYSMFLLPNDDASAIGQQPGSSFFSQR